jgi:formylglycine-generating enzyme required for sulfatase activity
MIGNVEEWCQDWYDDNWYRKPESTQKDLVNRDPTYLITHEYPEKPTADLPVRCVRSGSWADDEAEEFRVSKRYWMEPTDTSVTVGFRLVASME